MSRINIKLKKSKRNFSNNKLSKKSKKLFSNIKKKSKKINNNNKGGKPKLGQNVYTYFIIGHGIISKGLQPFPVPTNSTIITTAKLGVKVTSFEAHEIIRYYINNNRLFKYNDRSKYLSDEGIEFIKTKIKPLEYDKDTGITTKIDIRNHVKNDVMNDSEITFYPNKVQYEEYMGIIRYNHTTHEIEHYDINKLKQLEDACNISKNIFTLKDVLYHIFNTPHNQIIKFNNQVTIISFLCRRMAKSIPKTEASLMRAKSAESDNVPSDHGIQPLDSATLSSMEDIDIDNTWYNVGTKVLLKNGAVGDIIEIPIFSEEKLILRDWKIRFDTGFFEKDALVYIKGLTTDTDLNQKLGKIIGDFNLEQKTWPVFIDGQTHNISYLNLEVCHVKQGYTARITGINERPDLNGRECEIGYFNNRTKRWCVKVDKKEICIMPENLKINSGGNKDVYYHRDNILEIIQRAPTPKPTQSSIQPTYNPSPAQSSIQTTPAKSSKQTDPSNYSRWDNIDLDSY
jgi:hypothetical protein